MIILTRGYILLTLSLFLIFGAILIMLGPKAMEKSKRAPRSQKQKEADLIVGVIMGGLGVLFFLAWLIFRI